MTVTVASNWHWLECDPGAPQWTGQPGKNRLLFIAINMPGYYSLPARILTLLANKTADISEKFDCRYVEIDNNQAPATLLPLITTYGPDIVAFTVNIWNRAQCIQMAAQLRERLPDVTLVGGGQELTRSVYDFFQLSPDFDFLIEGEGEIPFIQLLREWQHPRKLTNPRAVSGLRYRTPAGVEFTGQAEVVASLDDIPSVILAGLVPVTQKHLLGVMVEGSRGCPFRCSFCFEGAQKEKVRTASIDRLGQELAYMVDKGATYFHMMDAILCNSDPARLRGLRDIFEHIKAQRPKTVISAELYADRITEEMTSYLSTFTIIDLGLQTTNDATAKAIHRSFSPEKYQKGVELLRKTGSTFNIYLICGLPFETAASFLRGIKFVVDLIPTRIFINELCLLNGTELRHRAAEYQYVFDPLPPYLVTETAWMDRFLLKTVQVLAKAIERRYNLTTRSLHTTAPWLPKHRQYRQEQRNIHFQQHCSMQCPGCRSATITSPPDRAHIAQVLGDASDLDVNIYASDGSCQGPGLLQLAGLLQLSATARNRLIAPLAAFADTKTLDLLVHRGFWHYQTFFPLQPKGHPDNDRYLEIIDQFNRPFQLVGYATIRPFLEVILLPGQCPPQEYEQLITELAKRKVTVVTVPIELADAGQDWEKALVRAFTAAVEQRLWLNLPPQLARTALAPYLGESREEIVALLDDFALLSTASVQPPCFMP